MPEVVVTRWDSIHDDEGNVSDVIDERTLAAVEVDDGKVSLHISPNSDDVFTVEMSPAEAWRLCRELARGATDAESDEGADDGE